ncbi:MAG: hypothetical protein EPO32_12550 [Anaerolineae bacterium]|nr:MAG: hypothetical protein EPO32_12550 [Anaerolineae bacterium]
MKKRFARPFILLVLLSASLVIALPAAAHTGIEVGPYSLVIGWLNEPPVVGERNAILIEVTEKGAPVSGVEGTLEVTFSYGGRTRTGNLEPGDAPGVYLIPLIPTVRGQYELILGGSIGSEPVDVTVEPEEVLSAAVLQFPEPAADNHTLQTQLNELTAALAATRDLAIGGLALGALGLLAGAAAWLRGRK